MSKSIPNGWLKSSFDEACSIANGQVDPTDPLIGKLKHIGPGNIEKFTGRLLEVRTASEDGQISGKYRFSASDVLYGKINPHFAKVAFPKYEGVCSADMYPVKCNNTKILPEFLFQSLMSERFTNYAISVSGRTGMPKINRDDLVLYHFDLPSIPEQQKIASILTAVDDVIESTQAQINKLKVLKTGMMQELLTKGIGHTEFKDSPVGRIPKVWDVKRIGDVCSLQGGYAFKSSDALDIGSRWLKISNVGKGEIVWDDRSFLPNNFLDVYKDYSLNENDIILALTRPVLNGELKVAKISSCDLPALLNQRVARVLPNFEIVTNDYLYVLFLWEKMVNDIETAIFGTDPPNVSTKQIESFLFPVPKIEEQIKIAKAIKNIIARTDTLNDKLKSAINLKKALMQDLLTGKVRVTT